MIQNQEKMKPEIQNMETSYSNEARPAKQIFILSGQNNMSGRGGVGKDKQWDGFVPPEAVSDGNKIFRLNADHRWVVAEEPLHQGIDFNRVCGVGPGLAFANRVKERVGTVGLVPFADAGTQIKEWARGTELYDKMVKRARAAAAHGGEIKALLWYQGEKDTFFKEDADSYKENVEKLILDLRQDLESPSLPVIVVALASGREYLEKVKRCTERNWSPKCGVWMQWGCPFRKINFILLQKPIFNWAICCAHLPYQFYGPIRTLHAFIYLLKENDTQVCIDF